MQKENRGKFTDFLVRYKRYFSAAVLVVVLVLILVKCTGADNGGSSTQDGTEEGAVATDYQLEGTLEKDENPELVELMQNYYTAYAGADLEALEMLAQPLSDHEKSYIGKFADYYEEYQNITCYSMQGQTEDSYMVSVCYDLKFYEVDTPAPGMDFFYVERDGKGNLVINNIYSAYNFNFSEQELDPTLYGMIVAYEKSDEVAKLQEDVQTKFDAAVAGDEKLATMVGGTIRDVMSQWRESIAAEDDTQQSDTQDSTQTDTQQPADTQQEETTQPADTQQEETTQPADTQQESSSQESDTEEEEMVKTKDICKVRKGPSTDAEVIDLVSNGVKLKKLGVEGDWTKVEFQGDVGYIRSDLLKKVKKKS